MKCPLDDETLLVSSREGIEIDHCPKCRGVWLDRGELDKIIERAAPSVVGDRGRGGEADPRWDDRDRDRVRDDRGRRDDRRYVDDDDDRYYRKKKRRGFLEDIFDFD